MVQSDYFEANNLVENGANVWHVDAPEGVCYVISVEMPVINNAYIIAKIPNKFAKNPRLYRFEDYYNGCFGGKINNILKQKNHENINQKSYRSIGERLKPLQRIQLARNKKRRY